MSYADSCDIDSYLEFYFESFPVAKKEHSCCECGKKILIGEKHLSARGKNDGDFWSVRQHMYCRDFCMTVRDELMNGDACLSFGGLHDFLCDEAGTVDNYTKKEKYKYRRIRSYTAKWLWESEGRKVFWKQRHFENREAE